MILNFVFVKVILNILSENLIVKLLIVESTLSIDLKPYDKS